MPFPVAPLVRFTNNRKLREKFVCGGCVKAAAWIVAALVGLNSVPLWSISRTGHTSR